MSIRKVKVARQSVPLVQHSAKAKAHIAPMRAGSLAGEKRSKVSRAARAAPGLGLALLRLQRKYGNRYVQKTLARISAAEKSDGNIQPKLMVSRAGDRFEQEANRIARAIAQQPPDGATLHRQGDEEEKKTAQMQAEDKDTAAQLQPAEEEQKAVQAQPEEEKKTAQLQPEEEDNQKTPTA